MRAATVVQCASLVCFIATACCRCNNFKF